MSRAQSSIRLLLAAPQPIIRRGVRAFLQEQPDLQVVAEAADGHAAVAAARAHAPHVVVMEVMMPRLNGIDALRSLHAVAPATRTVMLSARIERGLVRAALAAGAVGFVATADDPSELLAAIRRAAAGPSDAAGTAGGLPYVSPSAAHLSFASYRAAGQALPAGDPAGPFDLLTVREREVLQWLATGHATKEIAWELAVSTKTVEANRRSLMAKVGIFSVAGLTKYALLEGLASPRN